MSNETIELLKPYTPEKMQWPALHQQKIDGVPARITKQHGEVRSYTRQGERIKSIPHIEEFCKALLNDGDSVVMELHIQGKSFKDISGLVRRHAACRDLRGWIFDAADAGSSLTQYAARMGRVAIQLHHMAGSAGMPASDLLCRVVPGCRVADAAAAEEAHAALMLANPDAEGSVLHSLQKTFQPGKRCWGTQKMKPIPTIDLKVVGFEEAISADGAKPLGMVGRIQAEFHKYTGDPANAYVNTTIIGVGPGALNHTERKQLWRDFRAGKFRPRIAEIKYMRDDTYDALRQPTFKCWRDDKKEPELA